MSDDRKSNVIPLVAGAALLLAGYIGAYYATVDRFPIFLDADETETPYYPALEPFLFETDSPWYRTHLWNRFFAPVHWLDRRIRPHFWGES